MFNIGGEATNEKEVDNGDDEYDNDDDDDNEETYENDDQNKTENKDDMNQITDQNDYAYGALSDIDDYNEEELYGMETTLWNERDSYEDEDDVSTNWNGMNMFDRQWSMFYDRDHDHDFPRYT